MSIKSLLRGSFMVVMIGIALSVAGDRSASSEVRGVKSLASTNALAVSPREAIPIAGESATRPNVAEPNEEGAATGPTPVALALLSTCRLAVADGIEVGKCERADCPPYAQINFDMKQKFVTTFDLECECDELRLAGMPPRAFMEWNLSKKRVRQSGPCGPPIGSFTGKFTVRTELGGALVEGKVVGTLGYDADLPCPCGGFPTVKGTLSGKGVRGTSMEGCTVQWVFEGQELYMSVDPCRPAGWNVRVDGLAICDCP